MPKLTLLTLIFALFLVTASSAHALEIRITSTGTILFYQDGVLGETTDQNAAQKGNNPVKTIQPGSGEKVKVETKNEKIQVEVEKSGGTAPGQVKKEGFTQTEKIETDRIRVITPAAPSGENIEVKESKPSQAQQKQEQYRKEIRQERKTRQNETIELRSQIDAYQKTRLELLSRTTKAKLSTGSQFEVNSESNQVMIATPSGTYVLEHLPDQAVARMEQLGLSLEALSREEMTIGTNAQGELVYRTQNTRRKRVFGLFPREVTTIVELNDATGEVKESTLPAPSLWAQFLNAVSF